jgi:hypothetical protein
MQFQYTPPFGQFKCPLLFPFAKSSAKTFAVACVSKTRYFYVLRAISRIFNMISVTAAAHTFRRSSRSMGTHLKAFGSGRVALGSVDEDSDTHEQSRYFITKQPDPPKSTIFTSV